MMSLGIVISAAFIAIGFAIIRFRSKIMSMFFHHRALARIHARERTRARCAEILDSAHARVAIAQLEDGTIFDMTDFYNCLVDQTMVSSTQLAASFPGISTVQVRLAEPFDEFSIAMTIGTKSASMFWRERDLSPIGSWKF